MYTKLINKLKTTTVELLATNEGFRMGFSRYLKAKDKEAFMEAVYARYQRPIAIGEQELLHVEARVEETPAAPVVEELPSSPEYAEIEAFDVAMLQIDDYDAEPVFLDGLYDFNHEEVEVETLPQQITGLVKHKFSNHQLQYQRDVSFIEKTIHYARITYGLQYFAQMEQYPLAANPWVPVINSLDYFMGKQVNASQLKRARAIAHDSSKLETTFEKALAYLQGAGRRFIDTYKGASKLGIFVKGLSNGFSIAVNKGSPIAAKLGVFSQHTFVITSDTFYKNYREYVTRVLLIQSDCLRQYRDPHVPASPINEVTRPLSFFTALYMMKVASVDTKTLEAHPDNHVFIGVDRGRGFKASSIAVVKNWGIERFFGPSSPDLIGHGILRANRSYAGFAEWTGKGYKSFEKTANKIVARTSKLVKDTKHQMVLPRVLVVVDCLKNELVKRALSTGQVLVPTSVSRVHGQVRAVSDANKGGFKCTTSPIALFDSLLDQQDIALASFGSIKAKGYGLASLLGIPTETYHQEIHKYVKLLNVRGGAIKVVAVSNVTLNITNHYTIQQYRSTNRDELVNSLAQADKEIFSRAVARASEIHEDNVLVDYIIELRDTVFKGDLMDTIVALLKAGEIKNKGHKVKVTSSEFGILSTTHGTDVAKRWLDSLLKENTNSKKVGQVYRAVTIITHSFEKDAARIKRMSPMQFGLDMYNIFKANAAEFTVPSFAPRNLLVDLALYFSSEDSNYVWLEVGDVYLPLGLDMYGDFAENSTIYEGKVQITGFLGNLLKQLSYLLKFVDEHGVRAANYTKVFETFVSNMQGELQAYFLGKKAGKLEARGNTGVLASAWWLDEKDMATVYSLSKKYHKGIENAQAVLVKHPELFREAITGVECKGFFPRKLTKRLTQEQYRVISFAFESTIFIPEIMALALQNDADGDLVRITYHDDFELRPFSADVLKESEITYEFHKKYYEAERAFTDGALNPIKWTEFSNENIMEGIYAASKAKEGVGTYTALAQRIERFSSMLGMDKHCPRYVATHLLFNTMVQYFSMNAIKHKAGDAKEVLPDYFRIHSFDMTESSKYGKLFKEFLKELGVTKARLENIGFSDHEDWLEYIERMLSKMKEQSHKFEDGAYNAIAKDFVMGGEDLRYALLEHVLNTGTVYSYIANYFYALVEKQRANKARLFKN